MINSYILNKILSFFQMHSAANVPFELAVNFDDNEVMADMGDAMGAEAGVNPGGIIGKFTFFPILKI